MLVVLRSCCRFGCLDHGTYLSIIVSLPHAPSAATVVLASASAVSLSVAAFCVFIPCRVVLSSQSSMSQRGGRVGDGYHHRSAFKRTNKQFKGPSKGKQDRKNRGKVDATSAPHSHAAIKHATASNPTLAKQTRINRGKQLQHNKRVELLQQKRVGSGRGPPRIVALIPLSASINTAAVQRLIEEGGATQAAECGAGGLLREVSWLHGGKERRVVVYNTPRDQHAILDIAKVADIICFIAAPPLSSAATLPPSTASVVSETGSTLSDDTDAAIDVDDFGRHAVTILKAQGLPSVIGLTTASPALLHPPHSAAAPLNPKRLATFRRTALRYFHTAFSTDIKTVSIDTATDSPSLLRWWTELSLRHVLWRQKRNYMLAGSVQVEEQREGEEGRRVRVQGYLRGDRLIDVNRLVHLTGYGDYQVEMIEGRRESRRSKDEKAGKRSRKNSTVDGMEVEVAVEEERKEAMAEENEAGEVVLARSTDELRESLVSLNPVDPLAHEQSIITDEEMAAGDGEDDDGEVADLPYSDDDDDTPAPSNPSKHIPGQTNHQKAWDDALGLSADDDDSAYPLSAIDDEEDSKANDDDRLAEKVKLEHDELEWPDEVDYPMDTVCRERFARYRGLKSVKEGEWDVKENLPVEYSQIFSFADYKHSRAVAMREREADTEEGEAGLVSTERAAPVTITLLDVSTETTERLRTTVAPIVLFSLFTHEHKVSVCHYSVQRQLEYSKPIKGKEDMEFHVGFRRFIAPPIYSQHTQHARGLVDRYFHQGRFTTVSVYGRILFPPAPVLMFLPSVAALGVVSESVINPIVAVGNVLSIDPDRLLLKRIILTGAPISCHKRQATVRHMFFQPADVAWFKPVELWTKRGLVGHIRESHGLKGHMKCEFDGFIAQNDTVCMSLYKRQFPKFDASRFGLH